MHFVLVCTLESTLREESLALVLLNTWSPNSLLQSKRCVVEKGVSGPMLVSTELTDLRYVHIEAVKSALVYL